MVHKSTVPSRVILGLLLAIVLDTAIQIFWKMAVSTIPSSSSAVLTFKVALQNRYFYWAMAGFVVQMVNWIRVLSEADLSFAQPFTALGYVTVLAFSSHVLHEQISINRLLGVFLIFMGVVFISRTPHQTTSKDRQ